jgi:diacylglycerol kinase family enzyme
MICNQSTLAGNLKVAPNQTNSDDEFTVLIHPEACGFSTLRGLAQLKSKNIAQSFIRFKTKNLLVETLDHQSLKVFGDGEILTESNKLEFKEFPKKLRIFTGNC